MHTTGNFIGCPSIAGHPITGERTFVSVAEIEKLQKAHYLICVIHFNARLSMDNACGEPAPLLSSESGEGVAYIDSREDYDTHKTSAGLRRSAVASCSRIFESVTPCSHGDLRFRLWEDSACSHILNGVPAAGQGAQSRVCQAKQLQRLIST